MKDEYIYLNFDKSYFRKGDILNVMYKKHKLLIVETPYPTWFKKFIQFISFGLYKAPTQFKCKIII